MGTIFSSPSISEKEDIKKEEKGNESKIDENNNEEDSKIKEHENKEEEEERKEEIAKMEAYEKFIIEINKFNKREVEIMINNGADTTSNCSFQTILINDHNQNLLTLDVDQINFYVYKDKEEKFDMWKSRNYDYSNEYTLDSVGNLINNRKDFDQIMKKVVVQEIFQIDKFKGGNSHGFFIFELYIAENENEKINCVFYLHISIYRMDNIYHTFQNKNPRDVLEINY
jgi:hypothetical protein